MAIARKLVAFATLVILLQTANVAPTDAALLNSPAGNSPLITYSKSADSEQARARADVLRQVVKARSALWFTAEFLGL